MKRYYLSRAWVLVVMGSALAALAGPASAAQEASFYGPTNFGASSGPFSVVAADLNTDGKPDLAVANAFSGNVSVLLGNNDGTFEEAVNYTTGGGSASVAAADLNGDTFPDLAVANEYSNNVSVLLGNGDGTFEEAVNYAAGVSPVLVVAADLNGDTFPDLAVANIESNDVSVLLGNGDGTFDEAVNHAAGDGPISVAAADLNGDGPIDLAVANVFAGNVSVLLGDGEGGFSEPTNFQVGERPFSVTTVDLNADSILDLTVANGRTDDVSVLLGNGDGTFGEAVNYAAGDRPASVTAADLNGDTFPDLAVANQANGVSVLLGDGAGGFSGPTNFGAGANPFSVIAEDLNADGKPDLAVANIFSDNVSVLLNTTPFSDLSITKGGPQTATTGQSFEYTLTVVNKGPDPATNVVVEDDLPEGVTYNDDASSGSCEQNTSTPDPNDVRCTLLNLSVETGQNEATVNINVTPTQVGTLTNEATVISDTSDPNPSNNTSNSTATVVTNPDTTKPTITALSPPPGSTITNNKRDIKATVKDDRSKLTKKDIRLFVDGQERGRFTYDPENGHLVFDKRTRLGAGKHSVKIEAIDESGNTAKEEWSFTIR